MNYSTKYLSITLFFMVSTIVCSSDFEHEFLQKAWSDIKKDGLVLKNDEIKARKEAQENDEKWRAEKIKEGCVFITHDTRIGEVIHYPMPKQESKKIMNRDDAIEDAIAEQKEAYKAYKLTESEKNAKCRSRVKEDFDAVFPYVAFIGIIKYWTK